MAKERYLSLVEYTKECLARSSSRGSNHSSKKYKPDGNPRGGKAS